MGAFLLEDYCHDDITNAFIVWILRMAPMFLEFEGHSTSITGVF